MYIYEEMAKESIKRFFGTFWEDIFGYWRIYDFLKLKRRESFEGKITIHDEAHFWYLVLGDRFAGKKQAEYTELESGQVIEVKDMFLCDWAPKLPGRLWTIEGAKELMDGLSCDKKEWQFKDKCYSVFDLGGKRKIVSAGYGSVRIKPHVTNRDYCAYMSLVSDKNWNCDYGIPVVVSKPVYDEFCEHSKGGFSPWIEKMEGILILGQDSPFSSIIPRAIGASLTKEVEDTLRYRPFLPKCYIYISSPLNISMRSHNKAPICVAWTLFGRTDPGEPYGFTYIKFNPTNGESIVDAVNFIVEYVRRYNGISIVTDFDGVEPRLASKVKLDSNPMSRMDILKELCSRAAAWVEWELR